MDTALQTILEDVREETSFPVEIRFDSDCPLQDFVSVYKNNYDNIERTLLKNGAILFSGLPINDRTDFEMVMGDIGSEFIDYVDGNSPRTKLSSKVYTSTEYDHSKKITLHNELSYSSKWPSRIFFCCTVPSPVGGETPIADGREILKAIDKDLVKQIEEKGLCYIRNLHGGDGFGPSWQHTFETEDRQKVEDYCRQRSMKPEWKDDGGVRLVQPSAGIIRHRLSGEKVWFNQIDQFHPSHMGAEVYQTMMQIYSREEDLPMFITFGDGQRIDDGVVKHILEVTDRVSSVRRWNRGDLLLLDNELASHGRNAFEGIREVLVSMLK